MTEYKLVRSKRKSVAISMSLDGMIEVKAPNRMSRKEIERLLVSKKDWIEKNIHLQKNRREEKKNFVLQYGESVCLLGKMYKIKGIGDKRTGFDGKVFYLPSGFSADEIKLIVIDIYKKLAKRILTQKVYLYVDNIGVSPSSVKINSAKTRWGSCSGKNSINFSWRLMMADEEAVDYVVVHELCHIFHHNHSNQFWSAVEKVLPDFRERQKKLRETEKRISYENWD